MANKTLAERLEKAEILFNESPTPENELECLRLKSRIDDKDKEALKAEKEALKTEIDKKQGFESGNADLAKQVSDGISKGVASAMAEAESKKRLRGQRATKTNMKVYVKCDECIVERSESNGGKINVIETVRRGVSITEPQLGLLNKAILTQPRAKIYIPADKKQEFLNSLKK
jgi:hypothetical protein